MPVLCGERVLSDMSHVSTPFVLTPDARSAIRELDAARLLVPVTDDEGREVPAGSVGTVVGVWNQGEAYEVELVAPFAALATVAAGQRAQDRSRPRMAGLLFHPHDLDRRPHGRRALRHRLSA